MRFGDIIIQNTREGLRLFIEEGILLDYNQVFLIFYHDWQLTHYITWPLLLTWFNFNPSMDK